MAINIPNFHNTKEQGHNSTHLRVFLLRSVGPPWYRKRIKFRRVIHPYPSSLSLIEGIYRGSRRRRGCSLWQIKRLVKKVIDRTPMVHIYGPISVICNSRRKETMHVDNLVFLRRIEPPVFRSEIPH